jgi:hypothetical protein
MCRLAHEFYALCFRHEVENEVPRIYGAQVPLIGFRKSEWRTRTRGLMFILVGCSVIYTYVTHLTNYFNLIATSQPSPSYHNTAFLLSPEESQSLEPTKATHLFPRGRPPTRKVTPPFIPRGRPPSRTVTSPFILRGRPPSRSQHFLLIFEGVRPASQTQCPQKSDSRPPQHRTVILRHRSPSWIEILLHWTRISMV